MRVLLSELYRGSWALAVKGSVVNSRASNARARVEFDWLIKMGFGVAALAAICAKPIISSAVQACVHNRKICLRENTVALNLRMRQRGTFCSGTLSMTLSLLSKQIRYNIKSEMAKGFS